MQSADFSTPLSQAECVSLVMVYELCREAEYQDFLNWIAHQLSSERKLTFPYAVRLSPCLLGVCVCVCVCV